MFKKFKKISMLLGVICLSACGGSSLPECSDQAVIDVLKNIVAKQGEFMTLTKVTGISTKSRENKSCTCIATATIKNMVNLDIADLPIQYEINLSDDSKQFNVYMKAR